jgi:preprotein translocase subunit SecF
MNVIQHKYLFIWISAILAMLSIVSIFIFGFRQGIDFIGGTLWQIRFEKNSEITSGALADFLSEKSVESVSVRQGETEREFLIRAKEISEIKHQELSRLIQENFGNFEELSFASIGPAIGRELRNKAFFTFVLVLTGISLYIAFAFRKVSYLVSSWKYGFATLVCLFHDAIIPTGAFVFLSWRWGAEVDTNFIVALLVIMGFSVHDTIVVFDRIRENLLIYRNKKDFKEIVNESINQTLARSINTSLTLALVLIALYIFGAVSLAYFALLILLGTIIGTYSSIFVASPLLTLFKK